MSNSGGTAALLQHIAEEEILMPSCFPVRVTVCWRWLRTSPGAGAVLDTGYCL